MGYINEFETIEGLLDSEIYDRLVEDGLPVDELDSWGMAWNALSHGFVLLDGRANPFLCFTREELVTGYEQFKEELNSILTKDVLDRAHERHQYINGYHLEDNDMLFLEDKSKAYLMLLGIIVTAQVVYTESFITGMFTIPYK